MTTFPIPASALDDRLAFVGTSGSGKTYAAGTAVERLLADKARAVIVDPLGVWWGLRLNADGKANGFPVVIFGGAHGDLPINEHAGAVIGETVAGMAESCIVSLDGLGTKAAERRFMLAFLETMYRKATGEPFHIIFDEADLWAPQKTREPMLQNLMEQIVRRGRVKGFLPWLITQRPAVLSKDVLSQADGLVAMKLTSSQDRDALGAWIEGQADRAEEKRILARLPQVERGHGIVWIPGRGVLAEAAFPTKATFDSSRTPKRGEKRQALELKPIDLGALKDRLATVQQEAKANDPKALKAEIARLKGELQKAATNIPENITAADPAEVERARQKGYESGRAEGYREAKSVEGRHAAHSQMLRVVDALRGAAMLNGDGDALEEAYKAMKAIEIAEAAEIGVSQSGQSSEDVSVRPSRFPAKSSPPAKPIAPKTNGGSPAFSNSQQRIIASLAFWRSIGHGAPSREQVAAVAGYRPGSGGFNNLLGGLRTAGAIDYPSPGRVSLLLAIDDPMSPAAARDMLLSILTGPQKKIIEAVHVTGGGTREVIASESGYSAGSGGFNNLLGSLRTLGVLTYPAKGEVALADWAEELLA